MQHHIRSPRQKKVRQKCDNKVWLDKMSFNKKTQKQRIIYIKWYTNRHKKTLEASLLIRGPGIRVPSSAPKSHEES